MFMNWGNIHHDCNKTNLKYGATLNLKIVKSPQQWQLVYKML